MCFSVTQVESVDLLIRTKTLEHSQKNCYPLFIHNFMFHSWKYVINYLSTSIHPLSIQLCFINYSSTGFIHKSIVAPISWINKTWWYMFINYSSTVFIYLISHYLSHFHSSSIYSFFFIHYSSKISATIHLLVPQMFHKSYNCYNQFGKSSTWLRTKTTWSSMCFTHSRKGSSCSLRGWDMGNGPNGLKLAMEIRWGTGWESGRIEVGCFSDENERGNKHMRFCCSHWWTCFSDAKMKKEMAREGSWVSSEHRYFSFN